MVSWKIVFTKQAQRDAKKIARSNLREKTEALLAIVSRDPFQSPPPCEKLVGDLSGAYSRRINIQHRLVYQIYEKEHTIKVLRMWTHYD
jgi:Txe/YoeB family toxin of toxin-antitoxin system